MRADNNTNPFAGMFDLTIHVTSAAISYGLITTIGIGSSPLLAAIIVLPTYIIGTGAVAGVLNPATLKHGFGLVKELVKDDFTAHKHNYDERWERWWNPLSKRSALKWISSLNVLTFAVGFALVHPFIAVVLNEMWVLLLLPTLLAHRVFKQRTHSTHSRTAVHYSLSDCPHLP